MMHEVIHFPDFISPANSSCRPVETPLHLFPISPKRYDNAKSEVQSISSGVETEEGQCFEAKELFLHV